MLINTLFSNPIAFVIYLVALVIAITIHEFSHALAADKLGDPTPRIRDRVTLDPRSHIDPTGMIALILLGFGWGNPVPYDPYNLQDPKRDSLLIALAGPASNLILATLLALVVRFTNIYFLVPIIVINVSLAIFNLLPIPPLDGSKILSGLLSDEKSIQFDRFIASNRNILLILFVLPILGGRSIASMIVSPISSTILRFLSSLAGISAI